MGIFFTSLLVFLSSNSEVHPRLDVKAACATIFPLQVHITCHSNSYILTLAISMLSYHDLTKITTTAERKPILVWELSQHTNTSLLAPTL